jgi:hypothetical protein
MGAVLPGRVSPVVVRAAVWSLIGMIYAPLFVVLQHLLSPALSGYATVLAAAVAGAIGAAFYGARQLALAASLIGVLCATLLLIIVGHQAQPWLVAALAATFGLAAGAAVDFPHRCTVNMGRKFIVGGAVGALSGALLSGVGLIGGVSLPIAAAVAFLVSVTGVLYVTVLDLWRDRSGRRRPRYCSLIEGIVIAVIAIFVASSLVAFAGIFAEGSRRALTEALIASAEQLPFAFLGGMTAGAVTGGLLELFEFAWVDRD